MSVWCRTLSESDFASCATASLCSSSNPSQYFTKALDDAPPKASLHAFRHVVCWCCAEVAAWSIFSLSRATLSVASLLFNASTQSPPP